MLLCCFPFSIYVQLGHVTCIVLWHMNRSKMFWTKAVKSAQSSPCSFPLYPWDQQCERGDILSYWIREWIQMEQMELTHIVHITWPRTKPLWLWTTQILGLFVQMFVIFGSVTYNHQISLAFIYYIYIYIYLYLFLDFKLAGQWDTLIHVSHSRAQGGGPSAISGFSCSGRITREQVQLIF